MAVAAVIGAGMTVWRTREIRPVEGAGAGESGGRSVKTGP